MFNDDMSSDADKLMRSIIERIATGPEMSKDISEAEAYAGMRAVLAGQVSEVRAALFLIALRMKRESDAEHRGIFRALTDAGVRVDAAVDELMTLADPFNGFKRGLPMSPFLPAVLAACGMPCLSTGVETVAPKLGLTHHHILAAAGRSVTLTPARAARQLADPAQGWAYLDQCVTSPELHRLRDLRREMVKRSVLTTCEVLLAPVAARRANFACTGYVHTNYPRIYAGLAAAAGCNTAVLIKGVEGGVVPSLQASAKLYRARAGEPGAPLSVSPADAGITEAAGRAVPAPCGDLERNAGHAAALGRAALNGEPGPARDSLVYGAALALFGAARAGTLADGAVAARRALDTGEARSRFEAAA